MKWRIWLKFATILLMVIQGLSPLLPCDALAVPPQSQKIHAAILEKHTEYCHCLKCAGEKACCCRPTENALAAVVMTAACDTKSDALTPRILVFRALPSIGIISEIVFASEAACFSVIPESALSRTPQPFTPPPCLA